MGYRVVLFGVIVLLATAVLAPLQSIPEVYQVSEAREGSIALAMRTTGDYILPYRYGLLVPSKPPLFHWLANAVMIVRPEYDGVALRAPSTAAAVLLLLTVSFCAVGLAGVRAGAATGFVVLTSYGFARLATDGRVDMLFCLFTTLAVVALVPELFRLKLARLKGAESTKERTRLSSSGVAISATCCGLAWLTKGPAGVLVPGLVLIILAFWAGGVRGPLRLVRWQWLLAVLVPLPWLVSASWRAGGSFFSRHFVFENATRFVGGEGIVEKPVEFYLIHLFTQYAPWSWIVVLFVGTAVVRRKRLSESLSVESRAAVQLGALWFVAVAVPLLLSAGKRRAYLLLGLPGFAIACGICLSVWWSTRSGSQRERVLKWILRFHGAKLLVGSVLLGAAILYRSGYFSNSKLDLVLSATGEVVREFHPVAYLLLGAFAFVPLGLGWMSRFVLRDKLLFVSGMLAMLSLIAVDLTIGNAIKGRTHSYREFSEQVTASLPVGAVVHFLKPVRDESFDGFFFYYRRPIVIEPLEAELLAGRTYVTRARWFGMLPIADDAAVTKLRGGRRTDDPDEQLVVFTVTPRGDAVATESAPETT